MKKVHSIIEVIRDESAQGNKDWQIVTGQEQFRHPDYFRHKETGAEYSWISGGLAWHVLAEGKEGCAVVVGCSRNDKPKFSVVDAGFSMTPKGVIQECVRLRDKWNGGSSALFSSFAGPYELYDRTLIEINNELEEGNPKQCRIILRNPPDFEKQEADQTYLNTVKELSMDSKLRIDVVTVKDALKRMTEQDADKKLSDSPAVAAVAYVLYEMITIKPWRSDGAGPILLV
jgi:hypothetical protein